ncbi:hypothetical protein I5G60_gp68 [Mycobacterium phage Saguaro]|uniref:Uncharacterized protein n=1 Tax=Mycobacterium phage Saguaro TaxID=2315616 RepID=A0A386KB96_9CAUD|nr:hypothetical protein I5G60_gp68 [Mycobacterium phage Saguaro]AYD82062.1 hypothetical protein SEA_SAGUARO_68 [Mycobacterium phage Saguaro]
MGKLIPITDAPSARRTVESMPSPSEAHASIATEGVRLADMLPGQRAAVAVWLRNTAGASFWRAQGGDPARRSGHLAMHTQLLDKARDLEASR